MKKHNYVIRGMSKQQAQNWKENMRDDLKLYTSATLIVPIIELTRFEAFVMLIQIIKNNIQNHYGFWLVRI